MDKRRVAKLVSALRGSEFEPWWDDDIPAGASWEQTIEKALTEAQAVVVCWSPASVASENVRSEARVARSRGRLVQIFLEPCAPPLFFGERQGIDLSDWNGSAREPAVGRIKQALADAIASRTVSDSGVAEVRPTKRLHNQGKLLGATIALLALVAFSGWWWFHPVASAASRLAVQPIKVLGSDTSAAESLTDQITTSLNDAHIPTLSAAESQRLTGAGADQNLNSLGVGYTVSGTLERAGKTLHARLHLDDRVRHEVLWTYEATGPTDDPTTLNSEIANSIAGVISCAYRGLGPGGLTDPELLSRYLRVCDLFVNHNDAADFKSTFELFDDLRRIIAKAPNFTPAQSDFAKFGAYLAPTLPPDQAAAIRVESAQAARRALQLDPHSADAYIAQEMLLRPTDWAAREALLRKAVSVDPKWPHANGFLGMFLTETGRMREAAVYGQRAAAADLQIDWKPYGAKMSCDAGQADVAISDLRERLANSPSDYASKWALRSCLLDFARVSEAQKLDQPSGRADLDALRSAVEQALLTGSALDREKARQLGSKLATDASIANVVILWSASVGDVDTAFRFADNVSPGYPLTGITDFLFFPQTESMRRDPRFFALANRYGLSQFWVATGRWPDFCAGARMNPCRLAISAQNRPTQH